MPRFHDKDANHPPLAIRSEREALFNRCHGYIPDVNAYLTNWFLSAQLDMIKRQNVEAWILWAVFSTDSHKANHDEWKEEINGYVDEVERLLGRPLEAGMAEVESMRLTLQPVITAHRPFLWFTIIGAVDCFTHVSLTVQGFKHYATSAGFDIFPPRLFSVLSERSSSPKLSYWYRPHRSKTKKPIIFLHGIGVSLRLIIFARPLVARLSVLSYTRSGCSPTSASSRT